MNLNHSIYNALRRYFGGEIDDKKFLRRHKILSLMSSSNENILESEKILVRKKNKMLLLSRFLEFMSKQDYPSLLFKGPAISQLLYGDPILRDYSDIDILIDKDDLLGDRIPDEILTAEKEFKTALDSKKRKELYFNLGHDFEINLWRNLKVEWHWRLSSNRFFFDKSFKELYENGQDITIGGKSIRTFSWNDYALYLAVHGATHQWFRLIWLCDYYALIQKNVVDWSRLLQEAKRHKHTNALVQATQLVKTIFRVEIPTEINGLYIPRKHDYFINTALLAMELPTEKVLSSGFHKLKTIFYLMRLKPSIESWIETIWRLRTHPSDWEIIRLPDSMFLLYYILRPFLLVYKAIKK